MHATLHMLSHLVVTTLFPSRCLICHDLLQETGSLCRDHFHALNLVGDPCCTLCGFPFEFSSGESVLCAECIHNPPAYDTGRTVMHYDSLSRVLITRLKYGDYTDLAVTLAPMLHRAGGAFLSDCDMIIPVPLHWRRLLQRTYNQSALLGGLVSQLSGVPMLPDGMVRTRHTPQQAGLDRKDRLKNVKRAFTVNHRHADRLAGARVCLIDDVITTGATIDACCRALKQARVEKIYVLSMARTLRGHA